MARFVTASHSIATSAVESSVSPVPGSANVCLPLRISCAELNAFRLRSAVAPLGAWICPWSVMSQAGLDGGRTQVAAAVAPGSSGSATPSASASAYAAIASEPGKAEPV